MEIGRFNQTIKHKGEWWSDPEGLILICLVRPGEGCFRRRSRQGYN